jgi:hypothetical protein
MRDILGSPLGRRLILGLVAILVVVSVGYGLLASKTKAAPQQPIPFNHQIMVQAGMQCLYCHSAAIKSPAAGIPSVELCMGCHSVIATDRPGVQQLTEYWERQEPIPWVRVNRLPRFTFFAHNVHVVAGGLNCERCHGDVGNMIEVKPVVTMNMGWCLSCHNEQPNADRLRDCSVCHR